jgi:hypothetical protein
MTPSSRTSVSTTRSSGHQVTNGKARHFRRRGLQACLGVLAFAPLLSGILGLKGIYNPLFSGFKGTDMVLDSNLRFLNGMSIALSVSVYVIIPIIEKEKLALRIICGAIFLGGLARLLSIYELGFPELPLPVFMMIELLSPPILIYWQNSLAKPPDAAI